MDIQAKSFNDYLAMLRRYRMRMVLTGVTIALISAAIAIGLPPLYRSTGTILIEQQEIPREMVRSTITSYADQRIHVIAQRVMTRANLSAMIEKYDLYHDERQDEPMEVVLKEMRDSIKMDTVSAEVVDPRNGQPTKATIAFTVSYENSSPALAQKVANEIVSLYLNENLKSRTESASEATGFLNEEVRKLDEHIADTEARLAAFKQRHANSLPDLSQINFQLMDRTERDLMDSQVSLRSLRERKSYLESQLALVAKDPSVYSESGERILGSSDRLKQLQTKYLGMSAMYGENHPDMVRTRKEIESLKKETGAVGITDEAVRKRAIVAEQLDEARKRYTQNHPEVKRLESELTKLDRAINDGVTMDVNEPPSGERVINPAYVQIKSQIESAAVEIAVAEGREDELRKKLAEYEAHLANTPEVEREYRELVRDYENSTLSFKELKARQAEAQLAQVMENERKGERFALVEPPELPEKPLKPNRLAILVIGMVLAVAAAIGIAIVSGGIESSIYGTLSLRSATGLRPLVAIPCIDSPEEFARRRRYRNRLAGGAVAMAVIALGAIHLFYMPLDVAWYVIQRRIGLV